MASIAEGLVAVLLGRQCGAVIRGNESGADGHRRYPEGHLVPDPESTMRCPR